MTRKSKIDRHNSIVLKYKNLLREKSAVTMALNIEMKKLRAIEQMGRDEYNKLTTEHS